MTANKHECFSHSCQSSSSKSTTNLAARTPRCLLHFPQAFTHPNCSSYARRFCHCCNLSPKIGCSQGSQNCQGSRCKRRRLTPSQPLSRRPSLRQCRRLLPRIPRTTSRFLPSKFPLNLPKAVESTQSGQQRVGPLEQLPSDPLHVLQSHPAARQ